MAEEGTLGLARAASSTDDSSKEELQRRMEVARESISQTVTEIKDSVVQQYESVKETISETLDWKEQFKKRPVAWTAGAVSAGFLTGYCITSMIKGDGNDSDHYAEGYEQARLDYQPVRTQAHIAKPAAAGFVAAADTAESEGPGIISRIQETPAYGRIKDEASTIGGQLLSEVAQTAKGILVPAAVGWVKHWLEGLIPTKDEAESRSKSSTFASSGQTSTQRSTQKSTAGYQPVTERQT
jgi:hypothetical protein